MRNFCTPSQYVEFLFLVFKTEQDSLSKSSLLLCATGPTCEFIAAVHSGKSSGGKEMVTAYSVLF